MRHLVEQGKKPRQREQGKYRGAGQGAKNENRAPDGILAAEDQDSAHGDKGNQQGDRAFGEKTTREHRPRGELPPKGSAGGLAADFFIWIVEAVEALPAA